MSNKNPFSDLELGNNNSNELKQIPKEDSPNKPDQQESSSYEDYKTKFFESLGIMNITSNDVIDEPKKFWIVRESILLCVLIFETSYFISEPI